MQERNPRHDRRGTREQQAPATHQGGASPVDSSPRNPRCHSWRAPTAGIRQLDSDLFHPKVPDEFIVGVFEVMADTARHQYQILTKRPKRAAALTDQLPWPDSIWLGTSIESDDDVDRADQLRGIPAAVRFLSREPLLGPLPDLELDGIHWVIVGGESGHESRPMDVDWVRELRDRSVAASVPFFFKQWGGRTPKAGGRKLDGRTWDEMPAEQVSLTA